MFRAVYRTGKAVKRWVTGEDTIDNYEFFDKKMDEESIGNEREPGRWANIGAYTLHLITRWGSMFGLFLHSTGTADLSTIRPYILFPGLLAFEKGINVVETAYRKSKSKVPDIDKEYEAEIEEALEPARWRENYDKSLREGRAPVLNIDDPNIVRGFTEDMEYPELFNKEDENERNQYP